MKKISSLFEPIYVLIAGISLGLLWLFHPSVRARLKETRERRCAGRSMAIIIRIIGRHGARTLPFLVPVAMLAGGGLGYVLTTTFVGVVGGMAWAIVALALVPLMFPVPSA